MNSIIFAEHTAALWAIVQALRKLKVLQNVPYFGFIFKFISDFCNSIKPESFVFIIGFIAYFILLASGQTKLSVEETTRTIGIILSSQLLHQKIMTQIGA